jgi:DNA-directed RNA polymerase sigma subunit (sigma70/sigma32)
MSQVANIFSDRSREPSSARRLKGGRIHVRGPLTCKEIAHLMGVTTQRVQQIERRAVRKIAASGAMKELAAYFVDGGEG